MSWHQWMEEPWFEYKRLVFIPVLWPVRWQGWVWYFASFLFMPLRVVLIEVGAALERTTGFPVMGAVVLAI
jgi:hypothetical protein